MFFRLCLWGLLAVLGVGMLGAPVAQASEGEGKKEKSEDHGGKKAEAEGHGSEGKPPEGVEGGRFAGDPIYVHIAPLVIPVITPEGAEQIVTIVIDIEVKDFDTAGDMHTKMPKVRDALMRALYGGLGQGSLRNGKLVDVSKIKAKATDAMVELMGRDGIRDVLVQGIAQRLL